MNCNPLLGTKEPLAAVDEDILKKEIPITGSGILRSLRRLAVGIWKSPDDNQVDAVISADAEISADADICKFG